MLAHRSPPKERGALMARVGELVPLQMVRD